MSLLKSILMCESIMAKVRHVPKPECYTLWGIRPIGNYFSAARSSKPTLIVS